MDSVLEGLLISSVQSFRLWPKFNYQTACVLSHSVVSDSAIPWTVARQAPLSMGFSRQEQWSGLPFPPPGIVGIST